MKLRLLALIAILAGCLSAQMPKNLYPWWNNRLIVRQLNLRPSQVQQIRGAINQYRARLLKGRANVLEAEDNLEQQFNRDQVDSDKTREAIEQLITARSEMTRSLSELSLKLRLLLSPDQWKQLQRLRPLRGSEEQPLPDAEKK